jgi:uncharacterized iron-regulated membrane protein
MTLWRRWLARPQEIWFRRALFQIHLWTGIAIGLYLVLVSLTGSILVFRIELLMTDEAGRNLGDSAFIAWVLDLHDNLLAGETGRTVNGIGAILLLVDLRSNWKRLNWNLHSVLGIWFLMFVLLWGVTGMYLSFPGTFYSASEYLEPIDYASNAERVSDEVLYWLAYGHFGRFNRRFPGCGEGCDLTLKAVWAGAALVPPIMFVTGAIMWWNRVVRRGRREP